MDPQQVRRTELILKAMLHYADGTPELTQDERDELDALLKEDSE